MADLIKLLDSWSVLPAISVADENSTDFSGTYYPVCNDDDGIVAYFYREQDAYRFRLDMINRELNG